MGPEIGKAVILRDGIIQAKTKLQRNKQKSISKNGGAKAIKMHGAKTKHKERLT